MEAVAQVMVRSVRSELGGQRVEPNPKHTIRSVGQGQSGVCAAPKKSKKTKMAR